MTMIKISSAVMGLGPALGLTGYGVSLPPSEPVNREPLASVAQTEWEPVARPNGGAGRYQRDAGRKSSRAGRTSKHENMPQLLLVKKIYVTLKGNDTDHFARSRWVEGQERRHRLRA